MKHKLSFFVLVSAFSLSPFFVSAACLNLTSDLSQGSTDAKSGWQVTPLQSYLVSLGYLSATPNGVFGPATAAAVRSFQSANGISTTGTVGPLTRIALHIKSCNLVSTPVQTTPTAPAPTPAPSNAPTAAPIVTLAPKAGETLSYGDAYVVKWSTPANANTYNVVLEDANGIAQGFIVAGSYANQFSWQVGAINNSSDPTQTSVPPGTYRVHVENAAQGPQSSDVPGGVFTINSSVNISQMFPRTATADGSTSVVIYGSNFNSRTMVNIYGYGTVPPTFVSPDGRAIIFSVPTGAYPGPHNVSVLNTYGGSSNITSESNQMSLTVVSP